jgi:hypothetical protein
MIWGCFSANLGRRGGLFFLPKNVFMYTERYEQVLKGKLLPFMGLHKTMYFLLPPSDPSQPSSDPSQPSSDPS